MAVLGPLQEGARRVFRPVGNFLAGFTQVGSLKARIAELEQRNATLVQREEQVADIERENAELRKLLGMQQRLDLKTLPARVVGVGPSNFEDSVFIDRGSSDGLRKDMAVVGGEGLVGRIVEVGPHTARVVLLIDPSEAVAVRLSTNGETGVVQGTDQRDLELQLYNPEAVVSGGDAVVTSGFDSSLYPAGIPVGVIDRVEPPRQTLTRTAYVTPYVDFTALDIVLVVMGGQR
jgi:rod shape-determining protein MreC